jgi:hypothetical protein
VTLTAQSLDNLAADETGAADNNDFHEISPDFSPQVAGGGSIVGGVFGSR